MRISIFWDIPGEVGIYLNRTCHQLLKIQIYPLGMLAAEYAASRNPKGLKRLIIANSPASIALCTQGIQGLLSRFPEEVVQTIRKHEAEGTTDSQEYVDASMIFYKKHACTVDPWPEELDQSFKEFEKNPIVRLSMYVYC